MVLNFSSEYPHSSTSTNGLAMLRPGLGRCLAAITCRRQLLFHLKKTHDGGVCQTVIAKCVCVCVQTYPNFNIVLDNLLLLLRVIGVTAHELWLQNVACTPIQTEEGAVQLGVFIWKDMYTRYKSKSDTPHKKV